MHKTSCTNEARADYDIKQNAVNTVEFGICYHTFFKKAATNAHYIKHGRHINFSNPLAYCVNMVYNYYDTQILINRRKK